MKTLRNTMFICIGLGMVSESARGQCDKTWNPPKRCDVSPYTTGCPNGNECDPGVACIYTGLWSEATHWGGSTPASNETACIPAGKEVWVDYYQNKSVGRVIVYSDATNGDGEIYIPFATSLTLNGTGSSSTSTIDGEIEMGTYGTTGKIILTANHTFSGSGKLVAVGSLGLGTIEGNDSTVRELTLSSGFTLQGRMEAKVKIINNGTVSAETGTLKLSKGGSGSGVWQAKTSTGKLQVLDSVTGSGTWRLNDNAGAQIVIDATCNCLEGNVEIYNGTLDVNQSFETTGNLSLTGLDTLIDVASGKTARFSTLTSCSY